MNNNANAQPTTGGSQRSLRRAHGSRWLLPSVAGLLLLLLAASVPGYHLHIDEGWIGEQAYFLARDGYVHSNLFEGFAANDVRIVVYHRLFVLLGSWSVALLGWSIEALRVLPLLSGALLLWGMSRYLRREMEAEPATVALALTIFLLMPLNFTYIKVFRPEMLVALCGFVGYICLARHRKGKEWHWAAVAGAAGACAALAHPYGGIFPIAGMMVLTATRSWRGMAIFAIFAALPTIPYAIDIASHPDIFHAQITNPLVAEKTSFTLLSPLLNLLDEHKRLFRKPETILPTALFLLSLLGSYRTSRGERKFLQRYTLLLIVLLGAIAQDKVTHYAVPLLPFFTIETALAIRELALSSGHRSAAWRWGLGVCGALFAGFGMYAIGDDLGSTREHPAELNRSIASAIPPGTACLAPVNFLFGEIEHRRIVGLRYANLLHGNRLTASAAIDFATRHRTDAIVVNRYATLDESIIDLDTATSLPGGFRVVARTSDYTLLMRGRTEGGSRRPSPP